MLNILHITNTTLAGAPAMLSMAQRATGYNSICVQLSDMKPADRLCFSPGTIALGYHSVARSYLIKTLKHIDILHIHGNQSPSVFLFLMENIGHAKVVLQFHGAQNESANCFNIDDDLGILIHKKLIVAHGFSRAYDDYEPVPNCLFRTAFFMPQDNRHIIKDKLHVIASMDIKLGSRYGNKISPFIIDFLSSLHAADVIKLDKYKGVFPEVLFAYRMLSDITIDDILTGGLHLVSYEGLACSNAVINGSDELAIKIFMHSIRATTPPPFVRVNKENFVEKFTELINDTDLVLTLQRQSKDYFNEYLRFDKVLKIYHEAYESIL